MEHQQQMLLLMYFKGRKYLNGNPKLSVDNLTVSEPIRQVWFDEESDLETLNLG